MKKLVSVLALSLVSLAACTQVPEELSPSTDGQEFNFSFSYGYGEHDNELNSFTDTLTKDMIVEDPITVPLVLSEEEVKTIEEKINELQLSESPESDDGLQVNPCAHYSLTYHHSGAKSDLLEWSWTCENNSGGRAEFVDFMINFIESQEEYQALPQAKGGYL